MESLLENSTGLFNGWDLALWVLVVYVVPRLWRAGSRPVSGQPATTPQRRWPVRRHHSETAELKLAS